MNRLVLEDIRLNAVLAKQCPQDYKDMVIASKSEKKKETAKAKRELKKVVKRVRA